MLTPHQANKLMGLSFRLCSGILRYQTTFMTKAFHDLIPEFPKHKNIFRVSVPGDTLESLQNEIAWTLNNITLTLKGES